MSAFLYNWYNWIMKKKQEQGEIKGVRNRLFPEVKKGTSLNNEGIWAFWEGQRGQEPFSGDFFVPRKRFPTPLTPPRDFRENGS